MTLLCLRCVGASYPSQRARRPSELEQAERIRVDLGGEASVWAQFPPRPAGWSEERYRRAVEREARLRHKGIMRALADGRRALARSKQTQPRPLR
jgi:hypothetical protein